MTATQQLPATTLAPVRFLYREEWLDKAKELATDLFIQAGYTVPQNIRVTCGWPSRGGLATKKRTIGQCWPSGNSKDGHFEIFLSPYLSEGSRVIGVLIHEIVHAVVGLDVGHKKPFKDCAIAVGLTGKMTATTETEELQAWSREAIDRVLGPYPHATLDGANKGKTQSTRLLKMSCSECGCIVRTTQKWIDEHGESWPCPCGAALTAEEDSE